MAKKVDTVSALQPCFMSMAINAQGVVYEQVSWWGNLHRPWRHTAHRGRSYMSAMFHPQCVAYGWASQDLATTSIPHPVLVAAAIFDVKALT